MSRGAFVFRGTGGESSHPIPSPSASSRKTSTRRGQYSAFRVLPLADLLCQFSDTPWRMFALVLHDHPLGRPR
jgi:hypothetical protein